MNALVALGVWVLCGCITSACVYILDEDKNCRQEIYFTNLYIFCMVLFWPMALYFFLRFLIAAVSRKPGGGDD